MQNPTYSIGFRRISYILLISLCFFAGSAQGQPAETPAPSADTPTADAPLPNPTPPAAPTDSGPVAPAAAAAPSAAPAPPPPAEPPSQTSPVRPIAEPPRSAADNGAPVPEGERERMARRTVGAGGITFSPGEGLTIESTDHQFSVGLGFRFQLLYTLLSEDPANHTTDQSLQIRRARAQLMGHVFGEHNKYRLELAISPSDVAMTNQGVGTSPLLEAYTEFDYLRDLTIRAGQFKVPFDRMRVTSDMARQLVDYSGVTGEFSLDRDIGVALKSSDLFGAGFLRYQAGVFSGKGRNSFAPINLGLMYLGRIEVLPLGVFDDYTEGDFQRTGPRLSVGAAVARIVGAVRDRGTTGNPPIDIGGKTDFNLAEIDGVFKVRGFSALGGFYYRHGDRAAGDLVDASGKPIVDASGKAITKPSSSRDGTGVVAQAGYLLPRLPFEIAGRYASTKGSTEPLHNGLKDSTELGGGLNYYFAQHQLKLQTDYFRIYSHDLSDGYNQVRLQLQLVM
jgi:phosphate-selective porin OprO/OprP